MLGNMCFQCALLNSKLLSSLFLAFCLLLNFQLVWTFSLFLDLLIPCYISLCMAKLSKIFSSCAIFISFVIYILFISSYMATSLPTTASTTNFHPKTTTPHRSKPTTSTHFKHSRSFQASDHEVPSGPNPISN